MMRRSLFLFYRWGSFLIGVYFLLQLGLDAHKMRFSSSILQWIGATFIVQSAILGIAKWNHLLLRFEFPRFLSPELWMLHLSLRAFVVSGSFTAFLFFLKLSWFESSLGSWKPLQGIFFAIGLGLFTWIVFWNRNRIQEKVSKKLGLKFWRSVSLTVLIFTRIIFAAVGIVCTSMVVLADWLGLDPTPGWGINRKLQLCAGLLLLFTGYLLYDRSIHMWLLHRYGRLLLKKIQRCIAWITRSVLVVSGVVTMILVGGADWLGLDPTPGWGWSRKLQFIGGFLLLSAGIFLQNEYLKRWSYQHHGLKVLSPNQINLLIFTRILMVATGLVIMILVLCADYFKIDPTPGWNEGRLLQLIAGFALVASGFISHHATLLRWNLRRLFEDEK